MTREKESCFIKRHFNTFDSRCRSFIVAYNPATAMSNKGDLPSTAKPAESHSSEDRGPMSPVASVILFLAVCALGLGLFYFQRTTQALRLPARAAMAPPSPELAYNKLVIDDRKSAVRTANVQVLDFDGDGLMDILVCDTARNSVTLYRQTAGGKFEPQILAENLKCPAHATVVDLNHNGKLDVVVAVLGSIFPSDELVGKVVLLDNDGAGHFTQQVLLDDVRRVADVQVGDFDGDGKMDIAVAVFGYARGEVLWLQKHGQEGRKMALPRSPTPGPARGYPCAGGGL